MTLAWTYSILKILGKKRTWFYKYSIHFLVSRRDLTTFLKRQQRISEYLDPDEGNGELTIIIPEFLQHSKPNDEQSYADIVFKVTIQFSIEQPECGIHFFVPNDDAKLSRVTMVIVRLFDSFVRFSTFHSSVDIYLPLVMKHVFGSRVSIVILSRQRGQSKLLLKNHWQSLLQANLSIVKTLTKWKHIDFIFQLQLQHHSSVWQSGSIVLFWSNQFSLTIDYRL